MTAPLTLPGVEVPNLSTGLSIACTMQLAGNHNASAIHLSDGKGTTMLIAHPFADPAMVLNEAEGFLGLREIIVWRFALVGDIDGNDVTPAIERFFAYRDVLESKGITLVDEFIMGATRTLSLAVHTMSDRDGWNDVGEEVL